MNRTSPMAFLKFTLNVAEDMAEGEAALAGWMCAVGSTPVDAPTDLCLDLLW